MNMDTLAKQALEAAMSITGKDAKDEWTLEVAFKFACYAMAQEQRKK